MLGAEIRPILRRLRLPEPLVSLLACASAPVELVFGTTNHYSSTSAVAVGRGANEVKQKAAARRSRNHKQEDQSQPNGISCAQRSLSNAGSRISILLPQRSSASSARDQYCRIGSTIFHCGCGFAALCSLWPRNC